MCKVNAKRYITCHFPLVIHDQLMTLFLQSSVPVQYVTIDDAVQIIKRLGRGCADVRSAFRIIPDYQLLGMQWRRKCYVDGFLPMRCAS